MKLGINNNTRFFMVILIIILFVMSFVFGNITSIYAKEKLSEEKKIYANATIEDEFAEDSVIVVLGKNIK